MSRSLQIWVIVPFKSVMKIWDNLFGTAAWTIGDMRRTVGDVGEHLI